MKKSSIGIRALGLLVLGMSVGFLVWQPIEEQRLERRIRTMLLQVQEGLQNFHIAEELYPKQFMSGHELVRFLSQSDFLDDSLINPWTKEWYLDSAEHDYLKYRTDSFAETYELIVTRPNSEEVQFRLDSTENQSLEAGK